MLHSPAWCLCTQWNDVKSQQHSQTNAWNLWNIHCIICFLNEKAYSWHAPVGFMDNTKVYCKFVRYKMVCQQSGQHDIQEVMQSWLLRKLENSLLTLGEGFLKGGEVCIITSLSKKLHKTLRMLLLSLSGNKTTQEASLVGGHSCEWNSCSERCIVVWTTMQDNEKYIVRELTVPFILLCFGKLPFWNCIFMHKYVSPSFGLVHLHTALLKADQTRNS